MKLHVIHYLLALVIYSIPCSAQEVKNTNCKIEISGFVSDSLTNSKLSEATLVLIQANRKDSVFLKNSDEVFFNNVKVKTKASVLTNTNGYYKVSVACNQKYQLIVTIDGFITQVKDFSTAEKNIDNINFNLHNLEVYKNSNQQFLIRTEPINFEINSPKITSKSKKELNKVLMLLRKYENLEIEIGVHASSLGSDAYNLKLTKERANQIYKYLNNLNFPNKDRVKVVGYGETKLLNKCSNGVKCDTKKHQINKRVEFKILNKYNPSNNLNNLKS